MYFNSEIKLFNMPFSQLIVSVFNVLVYV